MIQPSLDESWWKLWGGLDGASGALVDKVLTEAADQLPELPDGTRGDQSWRKATALVELCISDNPPPSQVTVFVDAAEAVASNGQAGVVLEAGPRVGADALTAILCDATTEVIARTEDGRLMDVWAQAAHRSPLDAAGDPASGRQCLCRRCLRVPVSNRGTSHRPLDRRRAHRSRQPDLALLVPSSRSGPRTRIPTFPTPGPWKDPLPAAGSTYLGVELPATPAPTEVRHLLHT